MAAATENANCSTFSPEEILSEVRCFLRATSCEGKLGNESLTHSALFLLKNLPAARQAVLEHLCNVFDEAVYNHILQLEVDNSNTGETAAGLDLILQDGCGVLLNFIKTNPAGWAPIISSWSLELLGQLSRKYSEQRGVSHDTSLNQFLQMWMTCKPTKLLIEVSTECFAAMVGGNPDICVNTLLEVSVKYSPHFDWVVAHIGSCFPTTIITRVLMCGLKDFRQHSNRGADIEMTENKTPKMASVVGILGHLANKHGQDIRNALMKLFEDSLQTENEAPMTTIPFLLQLANMSPMLLQVLATDLVTSLTPCVLNTLYQRFLCWKKNNQQEYDSLLSLVVHLMMKVDIGAHQVLQFLLDTTTRGEVNNERRTYTIQRFSSEVHNQLLFELQKAVFTLHRDQQNDIPFLTALHSRTLELTTLLLGSQGERVEWLLQLMADIALYSEEDCAPDILSHLLVTATNEMQLKLFVRLQSRLELGYPWILENTIQRILSELQSSPAHRQNKILGNIKVLLKWEQLCTKSTHSRSTLRQCITSHWQEFTPLMAHSDLNLAVTTMKIFNLISIPPTVSTDINLHMCGSLVELFYRILQLQDDRKTLKLVYICRQHVQRLCRHIYAQCMLIRFLIESVMAEENCQLFGGKVGRNNQKDSVSLYESNQKHEQSLTLLRSHSSVFHAGIIGHGLKHTVKQNILNNDQISRNRQCLLELLWMSSQEQSVPINRDSDSTMDIDRSSPKTRQRGLKMSGDLCRMVGGLVVELTTPDVLYNNRFWPEEDSLRVTVERDLFVWKKFEDNPVLWDIMEMYASNCLVMCRASPVLKCLTATLMNHFEASREKSARNSPKHAQAACILVKCLAKSQLLPPPLCYVSELFLLATPYEVYLLLLAVWRYMKENPPTEDPEEVKRRVAEEQHVQLVRSIMHNNIDKMGQLYPRFFSSKETNMK
ncbi:hypothetical protein ScPMuIL_011236 [Solemya velum]